MPATITVDISRASVSDKTTIGAFLETYLAEFGFREKYPNFEEYWSDPLRHPFLILVGGECAGFALVRSIPGADAHEMAEFYVQPKYRGSGVGRSAVASLLSTFPGRWSIPVQTTNEPGLAFWSRVLGASVSRQAGRDTVVFSHITGPEA